ncbi:MAG: dihydrofolate reductase family protein [Bdellovibrio sp.]
MRKLIVISFLTLDGVMQAPGAKDEDTEGGFKYGGWQIPFFGDVDNPISEITSKAGALLLGRKTYDIFAAYWPTVGKSIEPFGPFMNNINKFVASKTLHKTQWQNSHLIDGDVGEGVVRLKREAGKDIYVFGSGDLSQTLMRKNLIDEYLLMIHPLVLGEGKRFFKQDSPRQDMELLESKNTKNGVLALTYKVKN